MDDYGHHPTAIRTTIEGLKAFYPKRRLIVSFMSHTYTRTAALLDEFAASLSSADIVILHKIYASAREKYSGGVTGKTLFEKFEKTSGLRDNVLYEEEPLDALPALKSLLKEGDLFLTMVRGITGSSARRCTKVYVKAARQWRNG
jgi:UDP-N-acetylmuramate--alanine ligase